MMGRVIMYGIIAVLGVFVLAATLLIDGGGKSTATVTTVAVNQLLTSPEDFDDQEFATRGVLQYDEETGTYSIVESGVAVRIVYELNDIGYLVDEEVRVTGRVAYDDQGLYIDADRVRPVDL